MDYSKVIELADVIKTLWNKQTKFNKYLVIAGMSMPSLILLRQFYYFLYRKYHSLPPGPNGLPLFGMFFTWNRGTNSRINLSKRYGPIFYSTFVGSSIVTISSAKLAKKILTQKEFLNRDPFVNPEKNYHVSLLTHGKSQAMSLATLNGDEWRKRRKLCQETLFRILNNENVANIFKIVMHTELDPVLNDLINSNKAWYPKDLCGYIAFNTIFSTLFGQKLDRNSQLFKEMYGDFNKHLELSLLDGLVSKLPFFKYIYGSTIDTLRTRRDERILRFIKEKVNNKDDNKMKSYIDYTHQMVINGEISQDDEVADGYILFGAGTDTTSVTLNFAIALIAKHQEIQDKVRDELINVMGKEFNLKIVHKCPIFRAAIYETMRISSVVFAGVNRKSFNDYWITMDDGTRYKIPKGTMTFLNMDFIHIYGGENENWIQTNGDKMCLENFLVKDDDGGLRFVVNESFMAFGAGRRDCVGRQLAMKEIQYTLGYLLMNYKVSLSDEYINKDITQMRGNNFLTAHLEPQIPIIVNKVFLQCAV